VKSLAVLVAVTSAARADDAPSRPIHGSVGIGGSLLLSGADGDRNRLDAAFDLKPSRFGFSLAWRAIEPQEKSRHKGLLIAGLVYEGAAARPRLVLDLHADAGFDLDARRPLVGGGARTTLTIIAPLAVILDTGLYLVIDGIDDSRLQLQSSALLGVRW
jgi:hypothetical protein